MKTLSFFITIGSLFGFVLSASAAETNIPTAIGIYDSRAVAYAYFWSVPYQKQLHEKISAARAAQKAGDLAKFNDLSTAIKAEQAQNHRQVFSIAPINDALEVIKERLPEIQKKANVITLVSKWDEATLKRYKNATRVDVTDNLVREFIVPDEKQAKTISSIEKSEPISLEKCDELIRKGEI